MGGKPRPPKWKELSRRFLGLYLSPRPGAHTFEYAQTVWSVDEWNEKTGDTRVRIEHSDCIYSHEDGIDAMAVAALRPNYEYLVRRAGGWDHSCRADVRPVGEG